MNSETLKTDFLVVGSGVAGLNAALQASEYGTVALVTKTSLTQSSSYWAQGGVAAVLDPKDTFEDHIKDTLDAGRGYGDRRAVEILVKEGAKRVQELIDLGMPFDKKGEQYLLGLEGGHSARRILHAGGAATGKVLVDFLNSKVMENPAITVIEDAFVYDLISEENRCFGARIYLYHTGSLFCVLSNATVLATGGYSGLFLRSTNPHTSTGDGLWLAYNHGAVLKDLEFVQFHPTAFYGRKGEVFLLSEALRGEGARLFNREGERFMEAHPEGELAPRDLVSREISKQLAQQKEKFVYLDVTHLNCEEIRSRFPTLTGKIEAQGIDISKQGIPVAPAAHYCIGGVETDLNGQTGVEGLYACGETAATGVHGANRLASNSLLECLVFSKRAADHAGNLKIHRAPNTLLAKPFTISPDMETAFLVQKRVVTELLNRHAGIERSGTGLALALEQLNGELKSVIYSLGNEYYFIRMREMLNLSERIILAALERRESRGVHFRSDFPDFLEPGQKEIRFQKNRDHIGSQVYNKKAVAWK